MTFFNQFKKYIVKHPKVTAYKPTSEKYDPAQLKDVMTKLPEDVIRSITAEDLMRVDDFIKVSTLLHNIYRDFYPELQRRLADFNMKGRDIIEYFIAFLNKEYGTINDKINAAPHDLPKGTYLYQDMTNHKLQIPDGRQLDVKAVLEGATDTVSMLCNYLRYHLDEDYQNEDANPQGFSTNVMQIFQMANEVATFKHSYDDTLYDQTYVRVTGNKVSFEYDNYRNEKLKALGHAILSERVLHVNCQLKEYGGKTILERYVTNYRVKRVNVDDGVVTLEFGQGDPKGHAEVAKATTAAIVSYYEFLDVKMRLEQLGGFTIEEALGVWVALQYVCFETMNKAKRQKGVVYTKKEMGCYPRKFRKSDLGNYMMKLTGIRLNTVQKVLNAFEVDWQRYNDIWTLPLYRIGDYYCLPFYPIVNSMPYNLIENLMQRGGYDLEQRGQDFEQYVYRMIAEANHQYALKCVAARRYGEKKEEIDLIVALRDIVVLAEAKCIHYSMEPQNYGNAWERLTGGAEQALKKAAYMKAHPELFTDLGDVSKKRIIPVVLTNYPIYAGYEYKGVYVIDSHTFTSYFNAGYITKREMSKESNPIVDAKFFYKNETEFSANFEEYLRENPVKKIHMPKMVIDEIPLLPRILEGCCTAKTAVYRGNPGFDIRNGAGVS